MEDLNFFLYELLTIRGGPKGLKLRTVNILIILQIYSIT